MYEQMIHLCATATGAMSGAYFAYRLAERRLRRGESDNFLALLLTLHEHLDYLDKYLAKHDTEGETAVFTGVFIVPPITEKQIQKLMELSGDKDMPKSLIQMMYFCRKIEKGMTNGNRFCLPLATLKRIQKELRGELLSLRVQYEQERVGSRKFFSLDEEIASELENESK